ncbi:MAG: glycine cleavage system protein GcvH [Dongiaceae bacterium]
MALKFTKQHEWVKLDGETAIVGISDYAQKQLGDVVFTDLPAMGKKLKQFGEAAVVESVKAASEVYAPISGEVIEINNSLSQDPGQINRDPTGAGWFFKLRANDNAELNNLMSEAEYLAYVKGMSG